MFNVKKTTSYSGKGSVGLALIAFAFVVEILLIINEHRGVARSVAMSKKEEVKNETVVQE